MRPEHIVSSFDEDLNTIDTLLLEMGGLVESSLVEATEALKSGDADRAKEALKGDREVNRLEADINHQVMLLLARRQPVAKDLRSALMTLRIAGHLERFGDHCKNMSRRAHTIASNDAFAGSLGLIGRMSEQVQAQIRMAIDAFNARDAALAEDVRQADEQVDRLHNSLFRELLTYMMEDARNISGSMQMLFIAKNIERMGDLAVDIAQEVQFMVTGEWPEEKRPKGDRTPRMVVPAPSEL